MDKRNNRTELKFSLALILILVIAVGAFFYGVKVGTDRTIASMSPKDAAAKVHPDDPSFAYQQQDLVSFYHTVFLPYREFHKRWFDAQDQWLADETADRSAAMKDLSKLANQKYKAIDGAYVPNLSPLLIDAQNEYLKAMKLFASAFNELAKNANSGSAQETIDKAGDNAYYKEGLAQALAAQRNYYGAMYKWAMIINADFEAVEYEAAKLGVSQWTTLPLMDKLKVSADYLQAQSTMPAFLPQDLTARVDQFMKSGQAEKMHMTGFAQIADYLLNANGVRSGDYLTMKSRYYEKEQIPQLPFFFSDK